MSSTAALADRDGREFVILAQRVDSMQKRLPLVVRLNWAAGVAARATQQKQ